MARHLALPLFAAAGVILSLAGESAAQNRSTGGTSGFGSSLGGSGFGPSSFGASSFGASSFGGSAFGGSSFGQSNLGLGSTGSSGSAFGSSATGTTDYVGRGALTEFVGRGAGLQTQTFTSGQTRSSRAGGSGDSDPGENARPAVRVRLKVSRELPVSRLRSAVAARNAGRRLASRPGLAGVTVDTLDGVTTLRGVVPTEARRLLAEKLLAIEPGVGRIDNRLAVAASDEVLPAPL